MFSKIQGLVLVFALGAGASTIGCGSVDPVTDVSVSDYRAALARISSDVTANLVPTLEQLRDEDLARPTEKGGPKHDPAWWRAKIGLARDVAGLASDVKTGAAK